MSSTYSRNRMISFRVSAEEYNKLREVCFSQGVRSLSEMARAAIGKLIEEPQVLEEKSLESRVSELESRLKILALQVKSMNKKG